MSRFILSKLAIASISILSLSQLVAATPPALTGASYNYDTRLLSLTFDQGIDGSYFRPDGFKMAIGPDFSQNVHTIHYDTGAVQVNNTTIVLDLDFTGINGRYILEPDTFYTWGREFRTARLLECAASGASVRVYLRENSVFNAGGEGNTEMGVVSGITTQFAGSFPGGPQLLSAEFDQHSGVLKLVFDRLVQWDTMNEDRASVWYDTLGNIHINPGNGILDFGEDRNGNGLLDLEKNIFIDGIVIFDDRGNTILISEPTAFYQTVSLTLEDSATVQLFLSIPARIAINELNTTNLHIRLERWAFTGTNYHSSIPINRQLTFIQDTNPLTADSATYDMGRNELKIYFNSSLSVDFFNLSKIMFTYPGGGEFRLRGSRGVPNIITSQGYISLEALLDDQRIIEDLYFQHGAANVGMEVESDMILGADYALNVVSQPSLHFIPESGNDKAPEVDSASFDASTNILFIDFDVRVQRTMEYVHPEGIWLVSGSDSVAMQSDSLVDMGSSNAIGLLLTAGCAAEVEMRLNLSSLYLSLSPFSVFQAPRFNGNRRATSADSIRVSFVQDASGPLPTVIRYDEDSNSLLIRCNKTVNPNNISRTGYTYSGVALEAQSAEMEGAESFRLNLIPANAASLANLPLNQRIDPSIDISAGSFRSTLGVTNPSLSGLTFGTNMSQYGGDFTLLAGWGKKFTVKSYEAFPGPDYEIGAFLRKAGAHSRIYAAEDQLKAYPRNMGLIPVTQAEIDTIHNLLNSRTPSNPNRGAYLEVRDLTARGNFNLVPTHAEILIMDIQDEFSLGRNDTRNNLFWGCRFEPSSPGGGETLLLDSWPQLYFPGDSAWYWYQTSTTREWRLVDFNACRTADNALINLLSRWMMYHVDSEEEQWVIEGISSICEQLAAGDGNFYGAGNPRKTPWNSLTYVGPSLKYRTDLFNAYIFMEYLFEKYGGQETIKSICEAPEEGMAGVDSALSRSRRAHPLPEPFQSRQLRGIFLDYGAACILDTSNGNDDRRFVFDNLNLYGTLSTFGLHLHMWDMTRDPPPYVERQSSWSYGGYYTTYYAAAGLTNPALNPQGNIYYDGLNGLRMGIGAVRIMNEAITSAPGNQFRFEDIQLDNENRGDMECSIPGWTLGPGASDYKTLLTITALTDEQPPYNYTTIINNENGYFLAPTVRASSVGESSIRLDFHLPWEEQGFGDGESLGNAPAAKRAKQRREIAVIRQLEDLRDNEGGLVGFTVSRSIYPDTGFTVVQTGIDSLSYLDTGLTTGRTYYYRVTADYQNPTGSSSYATASARTRSALEMSRIATAVSNFGNYGDPNAGTTLRPSVEWPNGSGKYYLWEGRFWAGAKVAGTPYVSHADYGDYEWMPAGEMPEYGILGIDNFVHSATYHDLESIGGHTPLGLAVRQTCRGWPVGENEYLADAMKISVEVENLGIRGDLSEVYLAWGFDCDVASGPGGDPDSPHIDDNVGYDPLRGMSYMYDDDDPSTPEDDTGEFGEIPGYIGLRLLRSPDGAVAHHAWWNWETDPGDDAEKYSFMSGTHPAFLGRRHMLNPSQVGAPPFDYRYLLSIGPFDLRAGEFILAEAALVMGDGLQDLQVRSDSVYAILGGNVPVEERGMTTLPVKFHLSQNWPNPFNPVTNIKYDLPELSEVKLEIFNIRGQRVITLVDGLEEAGHKNVVWGGRNSGGAQISSGIYICRLYVISKKTGASFTMCRKMLLVK